MNLPEVINSRGSWWAAGLSNWVGERVIHPAPFGSFRERIGFWLQGQADRLTSFFLRDSREEGEMFADGGIPLEVLPQRLAAQWPRFLLGECIHCRTQHLVDLAGNVACPNCGQSLYAATESREESK